MRKERSQTLVWNAAFWTAVASLFATVAPQRGEAHEFPASQADAGTVAADTLFRPAGVLHSPAAYNGNAPAPIAGPETTPTERGVWYSGYDAAKGAQYAYTGGTVALNGDLSRDGYYLRSYGSWLLYDLNPGHGQGFQTDVMLGYRINREKVYGGLYIGVDYQNYRLRPDDPTAAVRGTEWGFKTTADFASVREGTPFYYALAGSYSTSFQSYWARARVGLNINGFTFGPEGVVLGDVDFDGQRLGGFLTFDWTPLPRMSPLEIGLHVGHQFVAGEDNNGGDGGVGGSAGTYGGIGITVTF